MGKPDNQYPLVPKLVVAVLYVTFNKVGSHCFLDGRPIQLLSELSCDRDRSDNGLSPCHCHLDQIESAAEGRIERWVPPPPTRYNKI
jgi:hypothetical protein